MRYHRLRIILLWLTLFSIAMGYLESAVVVYLREILYPQGFTFPLVPMSSSLAATEFIREFATIVMLVAAGSLAGNTKRQRLAGFIYCFAIWDIFYYVFLKLLINWPESFFTWDILFLIPVIWTGPVISPILVSVTMIFLACIILFHESQDRPIKITGFTVAFLLTGSMLVFLSFIWDYTTYMLKHYSFAGMFRTGIADKALQQYIPQNFNWWLFIAGEMVILSGLFLLFTDYRKVAVK